MGAEASRAGDYREPDLPKGELEVRLSVYSFDLTGVSLLNSLGSNVAGAYHSGLVVLGKEWSFGGHDAEGESGVYSCKPEMNPDYQFYDRVVMGRIRGSVDQVHAIIRKISSSEDWTGPNYNLFEKNCNHFVSDLCWALLRRRPPDWINRTAESLARRHREENIMQQAARLALASYRSRFKGADVKFARLRSSLAMIPAFAVSRLNARGCVAIAMPLQKLSDASRPASNEAAKVYRWIEFANKGEQITEFDESHFQLEGHFESNSSEGHKVFQDRLRAIHFRKEGKTKAEIAGLLGRSEQFVAKWWQKDEREVPRPWGVHEYMSKELGSKTATSAALLGEDSATSTAAWWRDVEVRRRYAADPAIYEELLKNTEWKSSAARTRDFSTGASHVKYDKEGKMKLQGNQGAKYKQGSSPAFDQLLQQFFAEYGLADRTAGIALNWYPDDGDSVLGSHRHDCWTALFSFGHERILTIDKTPLLLQDCDLVIFGTQRHGVPKMPEVEGGRITVPIFFYPTQMQMKNSGRPSQTPRTLGDPMSSPSCSPLISWAQIRTKLRSGAILIVLRRCAAWCSWVSRKPTPRRPCSPPTSTRRRQRNCCFWPAATAATSWLCRRPRLRGPHPSPLHPRRPSPAIAGPRGRRSWRRRCGIGPAASDGWPL
ncbi:unnamed protein product [Effrenium voratum]|uniref:PPPDE domain-containing protein n=1 Tax=Effrenium voratum TaxID=2562239 RepID=A0AA36MYY5_9DINO|nr:unnamed protein product [Effrenium voratum]